MLHRESSISRSLNELLFRSARTPFLYQFDPTTKYLEGSVENEIMITMNATAPLVRYNIHDQGGTIGNFGLLEIIEDHSNNIFQGLKDNGVNVKDWQFPFIYVFGREQFMTSLYGVNIYPENIKASLEHRLLQPFLTGRFIAEKKVDENQNQYLLLRVELRPKIRGSQEIRNRTIKLFTETFKKLNSEYNQVEQKYKERMHPKVVLCKFQDSKYFPEGKVRKMA